MNEMGATEEGVENVRIAHATYLKREELRGRQEEFDFVCYVFCSLAARLRM